MVAKNDPAVAHTSIQVGKHAEVVVAGMADSAIGSVESKSCFLVPYKEVVACLGWRMLEEEQECKTESGVEVVVLPLEVKRGLIVCFQHQRRHPSSSVLMQNLKPHQENLFDQVEVSPVLFESLQVLACL